MEKLHKIQELRFDNKFLYLSVDNQTIKIGLSEISDKLANANDIEKNDFEISPSGYGIHWRLLDEDLSVNGLLNHARNHEA
jgi:hypothetical protein